jgi:hypothetical protein
MEMIWSALFGAIIMLAGVLVGYAIATTKHPKPMDPVVINTDNWPKGNLYDIGHGDEG